MNQMFRTIFAVLVFTMLSLFASASAFAQTVDPETETPPVAAVEALPPTEIDQNVKTELEQIFAQDENLDAIIVQVRAGVVNLSGDVPNEVAATEAKRLAREASNVVKVQDDMMRTLALTDNITPMLVTTKKAVKSFIRAIPLILFALLVLSIFIFIGNRLMRFKALWNKIAPNPFLAELLGHAVRIIVVVTGLVLALNIIGANTIVTTVLGGAGIVSLAIGFAVRDTIENYIASIMLSIRQPFRSGDHVLVDTHEGKVVRLTSRATILMTLDGNHLRIPNAQVFKAVILNYTTNPERRFDFELGVDAADDPIAAMNTGLAAIAELDFVLLDPGPSASIKDVGDSNIVLSFRAWINQTDTSFGKARSFAIRAATTVLEDNGFSLPEPIYRLKLDNVAAKLMETTLNTSVKTPVKKDKPKPERPPVPELTAADVAPDTDLDDKIDEERALSGENDLLDERRPVE